MTTKTQKKNKKKKNRRKTKIRNMENIYLQSQSKKKYVLFEIK